VDQGLMVYVISWKNPMPGMGHLSFEDYVEKGALKAIEITKEISQAEKINVLGYCLGGTLLSIAGSILAAKKIDIINSITFLASMVDFSDIGPMGDVINEALVTKLEHGELLKDDVMHGHDMERAFNLIRVKDMIWYYAINNYLKGETPPSVDVIYWTNDNTNLPAGMYVYYMRKMILENKLSRKNALRIVDTPIDIGKIEAPVFVIGMKEDYISPPATAFTTTELVSGPVEFILGGSGHVMGVANPPSKNKYGYYLNGKLGYGFDKWQNTASYKEGSWWIPFSEKLKKISGKQIPASKYTGNNKYKPIENAPGKYVKEKC
ncbi:MAG TPA: class I poly(R)-hydroxyalkanoic acid synthase, partial [Bacteroidia bacterium]|nr:class I poly(R)-hydroxyalkanoic acid synthase [Bacteroidia bacterium]